MPSVLQKIREWAVELPFWERAALDRIIGGSTFTESDYDDILQFLLEDAGLAERRPRPALAFLHQEAPETGADLRPVQLRKLSNLRNVNALAPGQVLTFGPSLTAIFGANGAGKSGYARVLGSAGFSRGDRVVLGDVMRPAGPELPIGADIEVADGAGSIVSIRYDVGAPPPALRSLYVFDSASVRVHLTRSSALSFVPAGLSHLTTLADVTDSVRKRLTQKIAERQRPSPFSAEFEGSSAVVARLSSLGIDTDLVALRELATLSSEERTELETLEARIAELKVATVHALLAPLRKQTAILSAAKGALEVAEAVLSDAAIDAARTSISEWRHARTVAESESTDQFRSVGLAGVGSADWQKFVESACVLAGAQSDHHYPAEGDPCLLCQRPLQSVQVELLERLWTLVGGVAAAATKAARQQVDAKLDEVGGLQLELDAAVVEVIGVRDPTKWTLVRERVAMLERRREALDWALRTGEDVPTNLPALASAAVVLQSLIDALDREAAELSQEDTSEEITLLLSSLVTLQHRARLGELLPEIETYVADCRWIQRATAPKVRGNTKHITSKYNELFTALVTDRYVELFEQVLAKLNCPRRVKVQTKAQKGETRKQIVLERPQGAAPDGTLEKVLSEGEQRAVALADFFTEVTLDDHSAGIVLDDPVTSLDFDWKETIARYLVDEARHRQVIVFTHDLHFLYRLQESAEELSVPIAAHWIEHRDGIPGWVFLDNSPMLEKHYRKTTTAAELWKRATAPDTRPDERQRLIGDGFGALRTCYEAFVIFDLFGDVVKRFEERISIERMKDVVIDPAIRDEVIDKVALLSRYIQGHLHSDRYLAQKPTPDHLKAEIEAFEALRKRLKALKKASGAAD